LRLAAAAVIVETVQGEGGVNVAPLDWLSALAERCRGLGILLIVDDVQMGCGRTGPFFSFESAGITPDLVCLSKSISGYGLPMAITLIRSDLDTWKPGERNGLVFSDGELARKVAFAAFERGLLVETAGPGDEVIKLLPPLTVTDAEVDRGLELLTDAVHAVC
jgi:diaminobutyrate-2-oxoglutarate transaminase